MIGAGDVMSEGQARKETQEGGETENKRLHRQGACVVERSQEQA